MQGQVQDMAGQMSMNVKNDASRVHNDRPVRVYPKYTDWNYAGCPASAERVVQQQDWLAANCNANRRSQATVTG
jgi:hypothetical protein